MAIAKTVLKAIKYSLLAGSTVPLFASVQASAQSRSTPRAATLVDVNIPAGGLSDALVALGQQAQVQIAFLPDRVGNRRSKAVKGRMTVDAALQKLLAGSGLRFNRVSAGSFVVGGPSDAAMRQARRIASDAGADSGYVNGQPNIPEILVVGRRNFTLNTDIPRTEDEAQPYTVFSRDEIKRSGAVNLEDFFRDFLGSSVSVRTASQGGGVTGRDSLVNLRGLGIDSTLILVDGRRFSQPNNGVVGDFTQSSVVGIPIEQVERIEVLASSAAGQYGSNAVGGVINIILRRDFKGVEISGYAAASTRGDADEYRISANATLPVLPETSLTLSGSWKQSLPLFARDRSFVNERIDHILGNVPTYLETSELIHGATPNIRSVNGFGGLGPDLVLKQPYAVNGVTALNSPITFIPAGFQGIGVDGAAALLANAGQQNTSPSPTDSSGLIAGDRSHLLSGSRVLNASATLRSVPFDWLTIYASGSYSSVVAQLRKSVVPASIALPASSPFNPFTTNIEVSYPSLNGFDTRKSRSDSYQFIGGAIFRLPWSWQANIDVNAGWSKSGADNGRRQLDSKYFLDLTARGLVDVLRDTVAYPVDYIYDSEGRYARRSPSKSSFTGYTFKLAGPLSFARLPGGKPVITLVGEASRDELDDSLAITDGPANSTISFSPRRSQKSRSAYGEIVLPLVGADNNVPLVHEIELRVAGRYDWYAGRGTSVQFTCVSHAGVLAPEELVDPCPAPGQEIPYRTTRNNTFNPVVAAKWSLTPDIAVRGSYSTGYKPPRLANLVELNGLNLLGFTSGLPVAALDPLRGNERIGTPIFGGALYLVEGVNGGNPNVDPEESKTLSLGAIVTPRIISGLTLRADWTRIVINNAYYSPGSLLNGTGLQDRSSFNDFLAAYPERFVREAPAPGDPFGVGRIVYIDATTANLTYRKSEALDFSVDYTRQLGRGRLQVNASGTLLLGLQLRLTPSGPLQKLDGVVSVSDIFGVGDSLKFRGNIAATYSQEDWSFGGRVRYYDGYYLNFQRTVVPIQGAARIPGQALVDLYGSVVVREGLELSGGIRNVFDTRPPIDVTRGSGYAPYGDPRLRNFYVNLTQRF